MVFVYAANLRRPVFASGRKCRRVAFDGIDRQPVAERARENRRIRAERDHKVVAVDQTRRRADTCYPVAGRFDTTDRGVKHKAYVKSLADFLQLAGELMRIAALVSGAVDRAGNPVARVLKRWLTH